jgi:F420-dependent methylenetetrahydromethanopterin dehydrogenase
MTPRLLREEAARFRAMAETTEREASKQRLLGMAADFEARAAAASGQDPIESTESDVVVPDEPAPAEASPAKTRGKISLERLQRSSS